MCTHSASRIRTVRVSNEKLIPTFGYLLAIVYPNKIDRKKNTQIVKVLCRVSHTKAPLSSSPFRTSTICKRKKLTPCQFPRPAPPRPANFTYVAQWARSDYILKSIQVHAIYHYALLQDVRPREIPFLRNFFIEKLANSLPPVTSAFDFHLETVFRHAMRLRILYDVHTVICTVYRHMFCVRKTCRTLCIRITYKSLAAIPSTICVFLEHFIIGNISYTYT